MVDLKANPFFLSDEKIDWVEKTIASMTTEEKIGQLFIYLCVDRRDENIRHVTEKYHIGGLRWQGGSIEETYEQNKSFQRYSLSLIHI